MSDKITLLVVKRTKHVLGAATLIAESDQVVGPAGILVRSTRKVVGATITEDDQFEVSADELEAVTADLDPSILLRPRDYVVVDGVAGKPTGTTTLGLTSNEATVTVAPAVTKEAKVWVQISGDALPSPRVVQGAIAKDATVCRLSIQSLTPGIYVALVLVEGSAMLIQEKPIS